jgi:hypothetical protein
VGLPITKIRFRRILPLVEVVETRTNLIRIQQPPRRS